MKLLTQFSIPNTSKADLAKMNNRTAEKLKKSDIDSHIVFTTKDELK